MRQTAKPVRYVRSRAYHDAALQQWGQHHGEGKRDVELTPRQVGNMGLRVLAVSGTAAGTLVAGWMVGVLPHDWPVRVMMVYMALLSASVVGAVAAVVAACQLTVGRAFAAGLRAGVDVAERQSVPAQGPGLRLVE